MHLGLFSYNVEYGARPDEIAREAEDRMAAGGAAFVRFEGAR